MEKSAQKTQWETVLVPLLPLRHYDRPDPRVHATRPARGWIYVFLNGHLWRELQIINEHGTLRDVDLGAADGVGDRRIARGHYMSQVVVPYLLNGAAQKIEMLYSRRPFTWTTLMKLGGLAPDDVRFTAAAKQKSAAITIDEALRQRWLQSVELSSYDSGFNVETGTIGPVATALPPRRHQRDVLDHWRAEPVPVVYLLDQSPKKTVIPVIYVPGIFGSRLHNISGDAKRSYTWDPDDKKAISLAYAKSRRVVGVFGARV